MKLRFSLSFLPVLLLALLAATGLSGCHDDVADVSQQLAQDALVHQNQYKIIDDDTIQHYLLRNKLTTTTHTASGVYVVVTTKGTGVGITANNQVRLKYTGRALSVNAAFKNVTTGPIPGKVFDTSATNGTPCGCSTFAVTGVIPGFAEGLTYLHQGDKALIFIPSLLGYGPNGAVSNNQYAIYPDSALLFEVEILEVI